MSSIRLKERSRIQILTNNILIIIINDIFELYKKIKYSLNIYCHMVFIKQNLIKINENKNQYKTDDISKKKTLI